MLVSVEITDGLKIIWAKSLKLFNIQLGKFP